MKRQDTNLIKMSSKGQIVVPKSIRDKISAKEGTVFAIVEDTNSIILKVVETPSREDLLNEITLLAKEGKEKLISRGFTEKDLRKK